MPEWALILAAYLVGAFLMIAAFLHYVQAMGLPSRPVVAGAISFIAWVVGVVGIVLAVLAAWGGGR